MIKLNFETILRNIVGRGTEAAKARQPDATTKPSSIRFTPSTQVWLECQAAALGSSVGAVANLILDGVVAASTDSTSGTLRTMRERFFYLFQAHGLDLPSVVSVMKDYGFTLSALDNPQRLLDLLDRNSIHHVASTFHVQPEWLSATRETVINLSADVRWYKNVPWTARRLIKYAQEGLEPHVMFIRRRGADFKAARQDNDSDEFTHEPIGVVVRLNRKTDDGAVFSTYQVWEFERWNYWRCREQYKLLVAFCDQAQAKHLVSYGGYELDRADFDALRSAKVLPVAVMSRLGQIGWYPDDYACLRDPVTKEAEDWPSIKKAYEDGKLDELIQEACSSRR